MLQQTHIETFIPKKSIEQLFDVPIQWSMFLKKELKKNYTDEYNMGLMRAVSHYIAEGIYFPEESNGIYFGAEYELHLKNYLELVALTTNSPCLSVPNDQICFEGYYKDQQAHCAARLYLAETYTGKEIFITDIFLGTPDGTASIGHNIFDEILNNIETYAKTKGYKQIGLLAAFERNMLTFSKRSYCIDHTPMGDAAQMNKQGYPMTKIL